jgi:hypothetical protein
LDSSPPLAVLTVLRNKAPEVRAVVVLAVSEVREVQGDPCAWVPPDAGGTIPSSSRN